MEYRLTHPQKRIWYTQNVYSNSCMWNLGGIIKLYGEIDLCKLDKTINIIIMKNDIFKLRFKNKEGEIYQYLDEIYCKNIDKFSFDSEDRLNEWISSDMLKELDIFSDELYHFAICTIENGQTYVYLKMHHIKSDGWSYSVIAKQICEIYNKSYNKELEEFETCSYIDFIIGEQEYLNSNRYMKDKEYWLNKFEKLPENLYCHRNSRTGGRRKIFELDLSKSLKIKEFIKEKKCSLNTLIVAAYLIYESRVNQTDDIIVGVPVLNRTNKKERNMIGMFTSTMPFRYSIDLDIMSKDLLNEVNIELIKCFKHQKYPYNELVQDLELNKQGYDSLFQVCINYYNMSFNNAINDIPVESFECYSGNQAYSLQLVIRDWCDEGNLTLIFDYRLDDYCEEEIKRMYLILCMIIDEMLESPEKKIKDISILTPEDEVMLQYKLNSTKAEYPGDKTIYELFEEQVKRTPDNIALAYENKELTYLELNNRANQLGRILRAKGINNTSKVGIMVNHSFETVIAILGVIKSGAAYVPIDPSYPIERINYMIKDSSIEIILTNTDINPNLKYNGEYIELDNNELYVGEKGNLVKINSQEDIVYIIYTSGSTGDPKGVMIKHRGLVNYIWWAKKMYIRGLDESFALYSSLSFDLTVTSIFTPLVTGNRINIYYDDGSEFILYKILRENKTNIIKLTPAHLSLIYQKDNRNSTIKRLIVGGEDLKCSLAAKVYESFDGDIDIFNEYGPTETVVGCMIYKFNYSKDKTGSVSIGKPADNVEVYILDKYLNILPIGAVGELYVSGDGVGKGYLNQSELTNKAFILNPFIEGSLMYRTGDTARYKPGGNLEYVGRVDKQVKIHGHRIELGEIEKKLYELPKVKEATVITYDFPSGERNICAYIVAEQGVTKEEIKNHLTKLLPRYMIPQYIEIIDRIPLTINGKVNTKMLPQPNIIIKDYQIVQASNEIQETLLSISKEVLNLETIGINNNFYELGGDSIKAIQIAGKLNNNGLTVKVKDILSKSSFEEIASGIEIGRKNEAAYQGLCEGEIDKIPITKWFFENNFSNNNHWNQSVLLMINTKLTSDTIEKAINEIIRHHDGLRINYNKQNNILFYNNKHLDFWQKVTVFDLSKLSNEEQKNEIIRIGGEFKASFDIENSILFRGCIFDLGKENKKMLLTAHHLVVDGVSWRIILEDLNDLLNQQINEEELKLPPKTHSIKDWGSKLRDYSSSISDTTKKYWENAVAENRSYKTDFDISDDTIEMSDIISDFLSVEETKMLLNDINQAYGTDTNEMLIIALVLAITKLTGVEEVELELEGHGREEISEDIDVSRTVGWFTSIYPVRLNTQGKELNSNIKLLKEQLRKVPNKGFDYGILKYITSTLNYKTENMVRINYLGQFNNNLKGSLIKILNDDTGNDIGIQNKLTYLIEVIAIIIDDKLKVSLTYSKNKLKKQTILNLKNEFINQIRELIKQCGLIKGREFTPSDFEGVEISQEDLDILFK